MPKRILVVEDNEDLAYLLSLILERGGFEVSKVTDGKLAEMYIAENPPADAALLDLLLPYTDGFELLRKIRASETWNKVPVLMLTAKSQEDDIVRALDNGANDYISKPFQPQEMLARLRRVIEQAGA